MSHLFTKKSLLLLWKEISPSTLHYFLRKEMWFLIMCTLGNMRPNQLLRGWAVSCIRGYRKQATNSLYIKNKPKFPARTLLFCYVFVFFTHKIKIGPESLFIYVISLSAWVFLPLGYPAQGEEKKKPIKKNWKIILQTFKEWPLGVLSATKGHLINICRSISLKNVMKFCANCFFKRGRDVKCEESPPTKTAFFKKIFLVRWRGLGWDGPEVQSSGERRFAFSRTSFCEDFLWKKMPLLCWGKYEGKMPVIFTLKIVRVKMS